MEIFWVRWRSHYYSRLGDPRHIRVRVNTSGSFQLCLDSKRSCETECWSQNEDWMWQSNFLFSVNTKGTSPIIRPPTRIMSVLQLATVRKLFLSSSVTDSPWFPCFHVVHTGSPPSTYRSLWVTCRRCRVSLVHLSTPPDPYKSSRTGEKIIRMLQNCSPLTRISHMVCADWFHGRRLTSSKISSQVVHNQSSLTCWSSNRIISRITSSWSIPLCMCWRIASVITSTGWRDPIPPCSFGTVKRSCVLPAGRSHTEMNPWHHKCPSLSSWVGSVSTPRSYRPHGMSVSEYRKTDTDKELNRFNPVDGLNTLAECLTILVYVCGHGYPVIREKLHSDSQR
jgi:hypothetical protein